MAIKIEHKKTYVDEILDDEIFIITCVEEERSDWDLDTQSIALEPRDLAELKKKLNEIKTIHD